MVMAGKNSVRIISLAIEIHQQQTENSNDRALSEDVKGIVISGVQLSSPGAKASEAVAKFGQGKRQVRIFQR